MLLRDNGIPYTLVTETQPWGSQNLSNKYNPDDLHVQKRLLSCATDTAEAPL